ncbi:MAG: hypothetical protein JJ902_11400 [Roseibium sp.]|nr:hypothetical protein [Roseibium sp.]
MRSKGPLVSSHEITSIQRDLLEAAAGELALVDVLQTIIDHLGGGGGIIFELNRKTGEIVDWITPNLIIGDSGYDRHINSINPRMQYSLRHAPGHVAYEGRFIDDRGMDRHEFYEWLDRISGFRYFLGSRLYDDGDISVFHSVEFDKHRSHPGGEDIAKFEMLARSVGHAWRLSKRHEPRPNKDARSPWTPDHLPWAIFSLTPDGRFLQANMAGRKMLDAQDFLILKNGTLTAADRRSLRGFAAMISAGLAGVTSETLLKSEDRVPSIAQAIPLSRPAGSGHEQPGVLVYVRDPMATRDTAADTISRLFRLSRAERNLVAALSDGSSLTAAADKLGVTRNTARNQLQGVFDKTGTRSQRELLVRILGVADN